MPGFYSNSVGPVFNPVFVKLVAVVVLTKLYVPGCRPPNIITELPETALLESLMLVESEDIHGLFC